MVLTVRIRTSATTTFHLDGQAHELTSETQFETKIEEQLTTLFTSIDSEFEGARPKLVLDEEGRRTLEALGYLQ